MELQDIVNFSIREKACFYLFNTAIKILPSNLRSKNYIINCIKIGFIGYDGKPLPDKHLGGSN